MPQAWRAIFQDCTKKEPEQGSQPFPLKLRPNSMSNLKQIIKTKTDFFSEVCKLNIWK